MMANVHAQLGAFRSAIESFEQARSRMLGALGEVELRAAGLPVVAIPPALSAEIAALRAAATIDLYTHCRDTVIPAVKGA